MNSYSYDGLGRVTTWTSPASVLTTYGYDSASNRTTVTNPAGTRTSNFDERNRLQGTTGASQPADSYTWTPRGTLASATHNAITTSYTYDAFERLTQAQKTPGYTVTFTYDSPDRPAQRGAANFGYNDLTNNPILSPTAAGEAKLLRQPDGDPIATKTGAGAGSYLLVDPLHDDTNATTDPTTGLPTASISYDPWGTPTSSTGTLPLGYQNGWTDYDTALVNAHARWYDPSTGGFTSRDTWTLPPDPVAQANRYLYANGSPLTGTDPSGHFKPGPEIGGGGGGAGFRFVGTGGPILGGGGQPKPPAPRPNPGNQTGTKAPLQNPACVAGCTVRIDTIKVVQVRQVDGSLRTTTFYSAIYEYSDGSTATTMYQSTSSPTNDTRNDDVCARANNLAECAPFQVERPDHPDCTACRQPPPRPGNGPPPRPPAAPPPAEYAPPPVPIPLVVNPVAPTVPTMNAVAPASAGAGGGLKPPMSRAISGCGLPLPLPPNTDTSPWSPTYQELRDLDLKDAHHIIQDARVNGVPGYDYYEAPSIRLNGPNLKGTEHYLAGRAQSAAVPTTYGEAKELALMALYKAGVAPDDIMDAVARADAYFKGFLCLSDGSIVVGGRGRGVRRE